MGKQMRPARFALLNFAGSWSATDMHDSSGAARSRAETGA